MSGGSIEGTPSELVYVNRSLGLALQMMVNIASKIFWTLFRIFGECNAKLSIKRDFEGVSLSEIRGKSLPGIRKNVGANF